MRCPVIIGGGGHARSIIAMSPEDLRPEAFIDSCQSLPLEWLGDDNAFLKNEKYAESPLVIGFVSFADSPMSRRREVIERYSGRKFATIIAPTAVVEPDTVIGAGTTVFHNAVVNTGVFLGDHVVVNTGAIIEHDATIGENTFIGPGTIICGEVTVGRDSYIGAGACVRNGIRIADNVVVGMGSVVIKNIDEPGVYAGNPAKRIK